MHILLFICFIERCMWLAPFARHSQHEVQLSLDTKRPLAGVRVWNYNKHCIDGEEVLRGARRVRILLDDKLLGYWVRTIYHYYHIISVTLFHFLSVIIDIQIIIITSMARYVGAENSPWFGRP